MKVEEERAIFTRIDNYINAWNERGDISAFFVPDADFVNVRGMKYHGQEAIKKFSEAMFETMPERVYINNRGTEVRFIRRDVAAVEINWELLHNQDKEVDIKTHPFREGLASAVLSKEKKKPWLIEVLHSIGLMPNVIS